MDRLFIYSFFVLLPWVVSIHESTSNIYKVVDLMFYESQIKLKDSQNFT